MPKTKFQDFVYTIIMVICMVYTMICYNVAVNTGGLTNIGLYSSKQTESITFEVTKEKETQKIEMKDMPILTDITLVKIDSNTKEKILKDFTFGIYEDEECTKIIQQIDSNSEKATITFKDLRYSTLIYKF